LTELVIDASVVVKWFRSKGETQLRAARDLRAAFEDGRITLLAPPLIYLELINLAGRRWGWREPQLSRLARALGRLGLQRLEPELERVARWTAEGLTAYDSAYLAVAEAADLALVTSDDLILSSAPEIARAVTSSTWA
jgi:predicted nucleic acid-binding protein